MSVTDLNSYKKKLSFFSVKTASVFIGVLFITGIVLAFEIESVTLVFLLIALLSTNLLIYFRFRELRVRENLEIEYTIRRIMTNEITSPEEIKLPTTIQPVEDAIKEMYAKAKAYIEYLQKLEKARKEFLGNVSHELKTPIHAIGGYIETLRDGAINDPTVSQHFLDKALQHNQNLSSLVTDLIDISMIEAGEMKMNFRYFKLITLLEDVFEENLASAEIKNLKLTLCEFNRTLEVYGDKARLKQVLNNLIQNAIKYTDTGEVKIVVKESKQTAEIFIIDSGIGISNVDLPRVFERFYRVDKTRSKQMGGTGLGLAIVKHILDAHDVKISVKSLLNYGSEFSFILKK